MAIVAAIPVLATIAVAAFVDGDEVTSWLEPRLSAALNRPVTVGDAGVAILPRPGVRLTDLRVGGSGESELPAVATVREAHLAVALLPLVVGQVHANHVRLEGLDLHLAIRDDGVSNFGDLVPESSLVEVPLDGPVRFAVAEVDVEDGSLTYFDGVKDRSFAVLGAAGHISIAAEPDGRWMAQVAGEADSLHVRLPDVSPEILRTDAPELSLTARGDASFDWIEVEEGVVRQWDESLALRGRMEGLADVDPRLDLRFENPALELSRFVRLVPAATRARTVPALEGSVDVKLALRGSLKGEASPYLTGSVGLSDVGLRFGGDPVVTDVSGRLGVRPTRFALDSIVGTFAGGAFMMDGQVERTRDILDVVVIASPELEGLHRMGLTPFGATLGGDAELVVQVRTPLAALDSAEISGTVRASGVRLEHERLGVPVYAPSMTLELEESTIRWNELDVLVGTDAMVSTGSLSNWVGPAASATGVPDIAASFQGESLDLGRLLPRPESSTELTYARIALAHLGGREVEGRSAQQLVAAAEYDRPTSLPVHGSVELQLGRMAYGPYEVDDVRARLVLADSVLAVEGASMKTWDGAVEADLAMGVGSRVDEPFSLELSLAEVEATTALPLLTPLGESVSGRLSSDLAVEGSLDRSMMPVLESLRGSLQVDVLDGRVAGTGINLALADFLAEERWRSVPFQSWSADLEIREGMLMVPGSELQGDMASATLSGAIGLGGAVDLAMALSIPADRLEAVSLRRTGVAQSVLDQLRESGSSLDLGIRISGTLAGPTLEPDALAASEQVAVRGR
ncbi:MAG: AsmA-like C-terminal region-containing protein [Longimicrobiales bacterium]|nr:AsmA-like C-terminal region-containing protein [Longimicrobiales bacterium]